MATNSVAPSFPFFHNGLGGPLEAGYIYIGLPGQNAEAYPAEVFWDVDKTIPATQPIRTVAGRPDRNGSPANIYVGGDYSVIIKDRTSRLVYSALNVTARFDSAAGVPLQPLESYAAAEAYTPASDLVALSVLHNGMIVDYVRNADSTALTTADGSTWGPASSTAYFEHWGLSPRYIDPAELSFDTPVTIGTIMAGYSDAAATVNLAFSEHSGEIVLTGFLRIDSQITTDKNATVRGITGQRASCGFAVLSNFDMSTDQIVLVDIGEPGGTFEDFTIYADQPTDAANRDALVRYPWALMLGDSSRSTIDNVRFVGTINDINMIDSTRLSNSGGINLGTIESGGFGETLVIDGAYDFIELQYTRSWPFAIAGFTPLLDIFQDGRTVGFRVEKADGLAADTVTCWKTRAFIGRPALTDLTCTGDVGWLTEGETITQATSGATGVVYGVFAGPRTVIRLEQVTGTFDTSNELTGDVTGALGGDSVPTAVVAKTSLPTTEITEVINNLILDAQKSYLSLEGGKSRINSLYSSKIEEEDAPTITCRGGAHVLGVDIRSSTDNAITVTGGDLTINGRCESQVDDTTFARVEGGRLSFNDTQFTWLDGVSVIPFIEQVAPGQLSVIGCTTNNMTTERTIISIGNDNLFNSVFSNRFGPHQVSLPSNTVLGKYETDSLGSQFTEENTSFTRGTISDSGVLNDISRRARGTKGALGNVLADDVARNELAEVYYDDDWQSITQVRHKALSGAGAGMSGEYTVFVADAAGVLQPSATFTSSGISLGSVTEVSVVGSYATRAALVTAESDGELSGLSDGVKVQAAGYEYIRSSGSSTFSDLPNWEPCGKYTPHHFGWNSGLSAANQRIAMQAALNKAMSDGGGWVLFPKETYTVLSTTYADDTWTGWVALKETNGARKTLVVYNTSDIVLEIEPGAVIDRSGDTSIPSQPVFASTLHVSKASRFTLLCGGEFLGYQVDDDLFDDVKTSTSGNHVCVNDGSDDMLVVGGTFQDGTNGFSIGLNRTDVADENDPALAPVLRPKFVGTQIIRNNEHAVILYDTEGLTAQKIVPMQYARGGDPGAIQRGIYFHSCSSCVIDEVVLDGTFKTGIYVSQYSAMSNNKIGRLSGSMMTDDAMIAATDPARSLTGDEGIAFRMAGDQVTNFVVNEFAIDSCRVGVKLPTSGIKDVRLEGGYITSAVTSMDAERALLPTLLDNPIDGLYIGPVKFTTDATIDGYSTLSPNQGILIKSEASTSVDGAGEPTGTTIDATGVVLDRTKVYAPTRNARVLDAKFTVASCDLTQVTGIVSGHDYDLVYRGDGSFEGETIYGNYGKPNSPDDGEAARDNTQEFIVGQKDTLRGLPYNGQNGLAPEASWRQGVQYWRQFAKVQQESPVANQQDSLHHVEASVDPATGGAGLTTEVRGYSFNLSAVGFTESGHGIRGLRGEVIGDTGSAKLRAIRTNTYGLNGHDGLAVGAMISAERWGDVPGGGSQYATGDAGPYPNQDAAIIGQVGPGIRYVFQAQGSVGKERPQFAFIQSGGNQAIMPEEAVLQVHGGGNGDLARAYDDEDLGSLTSQWDNDGAWSTPRMRSSVADVVIATNGIFTLDFGADKTGYIDWWVNGATTFRGQAFFRAETGSSAVTELSAGASSAHTTGALTGTTGASGLFTVSVHNQTLIFQNRGVSSATINYFVRAS